MNKTVYLLTYRDSLNKEKFMAIYADSREDAIRQFHSHREATDRLMSDRQMTEQAYREWKKSI